MNDGYVDKLKKWLIEYGAEIIPTTNPYEVLRWKGINVGVLYNSGKTSGVTAVKTIKEFESKKQWSDRPNRFHRKSNSKNKLKLIQRDGDRCFYCDEPLGEDVTIEHLIPVTAGGNNRLSNLVLAHEKCNNDVGNLPLSTKVKIAIEKRIEKRKEK